MLKRAVTVLGFHEVITTVELETVSLRKFNSLLEILCIHLYIEMTVQTIMVNKWFRPMD